MQTLIRTLNFAYHVPETRPWWRVRLRAMALTLVVPAFALASLTVVLVGPVLGERLADGAPCQRRLRLELAHRALAAGVHARGVAGWRSFTPLALMRHNGGNV